MKSDIIYEILRSEPMTFTYEEIKEIMFEELSKNPDEMDTQLIDLCADILSEADNEKTNERETKKKKVIKLNKALLVAAVIVLFASVAIPVSARFSYNEVSDRIVEFYSDYFKVNLRNGQTAAKHYSDKGSDLLKQLEKNGVDNVILPSALLEDNFEKEIKVVNNKDAIKTIIKFKSEGVEINGKIYIDRYNLNFDFALEQSSIPALTENLKHLSVNGLDIIIFEIDNIIYLKYIDNITLYTITFENCDFEKAVEIANTLK